MLKDANFPTFVGHAYRSIVVPQLTTDGAPVYFARHPELPGCEAHGDTPQEALANLHDARDLYLADLIERGADPPAPEHEPSVVSVVWTHVDVARLGVGQQHVNERLIRAPGMGHLVGS